MRSEIKKLPELFLERLRTIVPQGKFDDVANSFAEPKPTTFRINTLKTNSQSVIEEISAAGFLAEKVSWYSDAYILKRGRLRDVQELDCYKKGKVYVQSLVSMIPPLVLAPKPGETILDLTAAPGSKTTQIACLMKGEGKIVANDNNRIRFYKLKANLEQQGASTVEATLSYGESFGRKFPNHFDRVLCDVPCSAEARFNVTEPASYHYWKPNKIKEMAHKQKKLIAAGLHALKPGGVLVYSTCTYAPEENEAVLNWALEKFGDTVDVSPIEFRLTNQTPAVSCWQGENFHPSIRKAMRILPNALMEAFFVARLVKR